MLACASVLEGLGYLLQRVWLLWGQPGDAMPRSVEKHSGRGSFRMWEGAMSERHFKNAENFALTWGHAVAYSQNATSPKDRTPWTPRTPCLLIQVPPASSLSCSRISGPGALQKGGRIDPSPGLKQL